MAAPPGYTIPPGFADGSFEEFEAWINSVDRSFAAANVAGSLRQLGYEDLDSLDFDVEELVQHNLLASKAKKLVRCAAVIKRIRGYGEADEDTSAPAMGLNPSASQAKQVTPSVEFPLWPESRGAVDGLPAAVDAVDWHIRLVAWSSVAMGLQMTAAIDSLRSSPSQLISVLKGTVDPSLDGWLAAELVSKFPRPTMSYLGAASTSRSGLEIMQALYIPLFGSAKGTVQDTLDEFDDYPPCKSRVSLHTWLKGLDDLAARLRGLSEEVSGARWELKLKNGVASLPKMKDLQENAEAMCSACGKDFNMDEWLRGLALTWTREKAAELAKKRTVKAIALIAGDDEEVCEVAEGTPAKASRTGAGRKAPPAGSLKGLCQAFRQKGSCKFQGRCKFSHYRDHEIEIIDPANGTWRVKPEYQGGSGNPGEVAPNGSPGGKETKAVEARLAALEKQYQAEQPREREPATTLLAAIAGILTLASLHPNMILQLIWPVWVHSASARTLLSA